MSAGVLILQAAGRGAFVGHAPYLGSFRVTATDGEVVAEAVRLGSLSGPPQTLKLMDPAGVRLGLPLPESVRPPLNLVLPAVAPGTSAGVGTLLQCDTGTWQYTVHSYTYQWTRDGVDIAGATSATYTWAMADQTATVRCVVTAHGLTNVSATSNGVIYFTEAPAFTALPTLAGAGADWTYTGDAITFQDGLDYASGAGSWYIRLSITYQGTTQTLAVSNDPGFEAYHLVLMSYLSSASDIVSAVIAYLGFGTPSGTNLILTGQRPSERGTCSGTWAGGSSGTVPVTQGTLTGPTLTGTAGTVTGTPTPSVTNSWRLCNSGGGSCSTISGQTGGTLLVTAAMAGSTIRFRQTATNEVTSVSADSAATALIAITP